MNTRVPADCRERAMDTCGLDVTPQLENVKKCNSKLTFFWLQYLVQETFCAELSL